MGEGLADVDLAQAGVFDDRVEQEDDRSRYLRLEAGTHHRLGERRVVHRQTDQQRWRQSALQAALNRVPVSTATVGGMNGIGAGVGRGIGVDVGAASVPRPLSGERAASNSSAMLGVRPGMYDGRSLSTPQSLTATRRPVRASRGGYRHVVRLLQWDAELVGDTRQGRLCQRLDRFLVPALDLLDVSIGQILTGGHAAVGRLLDDRLGLGDQASR